MPGRYENVAHENFAVAVFVAALVPFAATNALGDVTISSAATKDMTCSSGVCAPTASSAVLNVTDLENLLASGNVEVTTTGSGVQADNIDVNAALSWSGTGALALDAYDSVTIGSAVSITGLSGLSLTTNDGGSGGVVSITGTGSVAFQNLSSQLAINGTSYVLVDSISTLAADIASNQDGAYALASPYDASGDGTYSASPITTVFTGSLEGLGNTISHLSIDDSTDQTVLALLIVNYGTISHLGLSHVNIVSDVPDGAVGALVGVNDGSLFQDFATGSIRARGKGTGVGGLVGFNADGIYQSVSIDRSFANVRIMGGPAKPGETGGAGGLVGVNSLGIIRESFSTGSVKVDGTGVGGGLVGANVGEAGFPGTIEDCYATGAVTGGQKSKIGGVVGEEANIDAHGGDEIIETSYSTGAVAAGSSGKVGGFVGESNIHTQYKDAYWDTTTSGTNKGSGTGEDRGVTGLTTQELQSGLPTGFNASIWAEDSGINDGLPYLIANPPPQ